MESLRTSGKREAEKLLGRSLIRRTSGGGRDTGPEDPRQDQEDWGLGTPGRLQGREPHTRWEEEQSEMLQSVFSSGLEEQRSGCGLW